MVAAARNPPPHVHRAPEARLHLRDGPVPLTLIPECSVILSGASLRAKSKDPHLVASSAWVADPSQAQDDMQPVEDPEPTGRCAKLARVRARWTGTRPEGCGCREAGG